MERQLRDVVDPERASSGGPGREAPAVHAARADKTVCFLAHFAEADHRPRLACGVEALAMLERYPWPGNVRKPRNVVERAVMLADLGDTALVPALLPRHARGEPAVDSSARVSGGPSSG